VSHILDDESCSNGDQAYAGTDTGPEVLTTCSTIQIQTRQQLTESKEEKATEAERMLLR
jgi:hypothetical protein